MAEIIATEQQALAIGGGSCSSYVTYRAVTKQQATYFGASTRNNTYANSQLVRYVDLYKACGDSCYSCYSCDKCGDSCYSCYTCDKCGDSCYTCGDCPSKCGDSCYTCDKCGDSCYTCGDCPSKQCDKTDTCDWKTISYGQPSKEEKGYTGGECWPHGSFHTVGSTNDVTCLNCHDKTMCGCKGVGTGCSSYTGSSKCSGISVNGCKCVNIQTCPCQAILTYPGTCACHGAY